MLICITRWYAKGEVEELYAIDPENVVGVGTSDIRLQDMNGEFIKKGRHNYKKKEVTRIDYRYRHGQYGIESIYTLTPLLDIVEAVNVVLGHGPLKRVDGGEDEHSA